jgi:hypothetical protein
MRAPSKGGATGSEEEDERGRRRRVERVIMAAYDNIFDDVIGNYLICDVNFCAFSKEEGGLSRKKLFFFIYSGVFFRQDNRINRNIC